ncbi:hypothetical protein Q4489_06430 [Thalassotalea sp. 1_MG-2023]|uniref:MMPL family transporter n=1 Tax=Thalassotalea sp. 1_MG-2023 TaxID=3062680 RepID=UPI0026E21F01|nr:hypothetical protein [Thalassotalea sp. 1_MG-2023]MDO6426642.1 hypothetical protein [Thalassotalea sp. 1_MG-2023]
MKKRIGLLIVQVLITVMMLLYLARQGINVQADILSTLPASDYPEFVIDAEKKLFQRSANQIIVSFAGENKVVAYQHMLSNIQQKGWQATLPNKDRINQLANFYSQYTGSVLSNDFRKNISTKKRYDNYFNQQLSQVANPIVSQTFTNDPSLATASFIHERLFQYSSVTVKENYFIATSSPKQPILLFIDVRETEKPPVDINQTIVISEQVKRLVSETLLQYPELTIKTSGILLHTAENAANAKWEMSVFGSLSLLATIVLVVWAFHSIIPVFWIMLTVGNAFLVGLCALMWSFESIHVITLVFGVTLIGLTVDYCLHVLTSKYVRPRHRVGKTLFFALVTTLICYGLFYFTPLLILKQVAVFVSFGLIAAFFTSLWLERVLIFQDLNQSSVRILNLREFKSLLLKFQPIVLTVVGTIIVVSIFKPLQFDDNIASLNASSDELIDAERYHFKLLNQQSIYRVFIYANSIEALLQKEEVIAAQLRTAYPLVNINKLSDWLPSKTQQIFNFQRFKEAEENDVFSLLTKMVPTFQLPSNGAYLTFDNFSQSLQMQYVNHLYTGTENGHVSVMELSAIPKQAISSFLADKNQTILFDKQSSLTDVVQQFRQALSYWLIAAIGAILLLLLIRYELKTMLKAAMVMVASIYSALFISQLFNGTLSIFNLLSAMLLIGLAVDYLIFYRERQLSQANFLAVSLSAASSILVFGMLAFSQTPAIYSFGLTVTVGLLLIYILAPIVAKE